jgi:hypothetical protein
MKQYAIRVKETGEKFISTDIDRAFEMLDQHFGDLAEVVYYDETKKDWVPAVRVIRNAKLHSISLVADPPHPSWKIETVKEEKPKYGIGNLDLLKEP